MSPRLLTPILLVIIAKEKTNKETKVQGKV